MAETYGTFKARVRYTLGDTDRSNYAVGEDRLRQICTNAVQMIGEAVNPGTQWLASPIALVAGQTDYALPGAGAQYAQLIIVRRQSDRWPLYKRTVADLEASWIGQTQSTGTNMLEYAAWEDDAQQVNIRVRPVPAANVSDKLEIFYSDLPVELASDSTVIPFSYPLIAGLVKYVCAECLALLDDKSLARLGLSRTAAPFWQQQADKAFNQEIVRINRLKRVANTQRMDP